jgi:hypothetical protein
VSQDLHPAHCAQQAPFRQTPGNRRASRVLPARSLIQRDQFSAAAVQPIQLHRVAGPQVAQLVQMAQNQATASTVGLLPPGPLDRLL